MAPPTDYQHEQDDGIPNFHNSLLAENASLDVNALINRVTTPFFIVTDVTCNGTTLRAPLAREGIQFWANYSKKYEEKVRNIVRTFNAAHSSINNWPDDEDDAIQTIAEATGNDIRKLKLTRKYGEDAPAHEDGGAKTIVLAGAFRYLTLSTAQVDLAINLTHDATQLQIRD